MKIRGQTFDSTIPVIFLVDDGGYVNLLGSTIEHISRKLKVKSKSFENSHLYYFDDNYIIKGSVYRMPEYFKETFRKLL